MQMILLALAAFVTIAACAAWVLRAYLRAGADRRGAGAAAGLAAAAGLLAAIAYLALGEPNLPAAPMDARVAALEARLEQDASALRLDEMLALLSNRARTDPNDPRPHHYSGRIYETAGEDARAAQAYRTALLRDPAFAPALIDLARLEFRLAQGAVTPQALALFKRASEVAPAEPLPWFYMALAASQQRQWAEAGALWARVAETLPEDDPRQAMVAKMREEAAAAVAPK